jgi:hypothetical protein
MKRTVSINKETEKWEKKLFLSSNLMTKTIVNANHNTTRAAKLLASS